MPLTPEHKRQIAQFMLIAEHYLSLAGPAAHERETLGMTKHVFMPSNPVTAASVKLAIVGAHISSAAIRLTSIEGVLEDAHNANPSYRRCRDYFNGKTSMPDNDLRGSTCSEWFHVRLRDNVA
jgi:hypothetical protein